MTVKLKLETDIDLNSYYDSFPPKLRLEIQAAVSKLVTSGGSGQLRTTSRRLRKTEAAPEGNYALTGKTPSKVTGKSYKIVLAVQRLYPKGEYFSGEMFQEVLNDTLGPQSQRTAVSIWISTLIKSGYLKEVK